MKIGLLGGTGPEGKSLALRFAMAGHEIYIGSRDITKSYEVAKEIKEKLLSILPQSPVIHGETNENTSLNSEVIFITVPYNAQKQLISGLKNTLNDQIIVNTVVPMNFENGKPSIVTVKEGSAAEQIQTIVPNMRVISAFHNVSAVELLKTNAIIEGDVIVCGNDEKAKEIIMDLTKTIKNLRPIDGGDLINSSIVENITVLLLSINKRYKTRTNIQIKGIK